MLTFLEILGDILGFLAIASAAFLIVVIFVTSQHDLSTNRTSVWEITE